MDSFSELISTPIPLHWGFIYISVICEARSVRSSACIKIPLRVRQRYFVFVSTVGLRTLYPGTSLYEHILWMHLEKNRTHASTFPVQSKEINVVKVRFTMRYSSRKLSNDKVITTACNFWGQISCAFQVMSGNILFWGKKIFEIPPFFQTRPGDLGKKVHACSLRFSALNLHDYINPFAPEPPVTARADPGLFYPLWRHQF